MSPLPFFNELVRLGRAVQARHPRRLLVIAAAMVAGIALVVWPWTIERGPAWERSDRMTGVVMMVLFAWTAWWAWAGRPPRNRMRRYERWMAATVMLCVGGVSVASIVSPSWATHEPTAGAGASTGLACYVACAAALVSLWALIAPVRDAME